MRDIPLNDFALDILNESLWFVQNDNYKSVICRKMDKHTKEDADYYTGDEYFKKIKNMGTGHDGFPEIVVAHSFGIGQLHFSREKGITQKIPEVSMRQDSFLSKIQTTFNLKRNALFSIYPPGGYISWHNNANASAFNFIFTWSETGDGYWRHWDNEKKEMITIPDVKGWQCKAGYFGAYEDPEEKLLYHTARTNDSLRMTVAFVLDRSEMSQGIQDWVIEDIHA
jgi:hypothetical protein